MTLDEWAEAKIPDVYRPTFSELPVDAATLVALPGEVARLRAEQPSEAELLAGSLVTWTAKADEPSICNEVAWEFAQQRNGKAALASVSCALRHSPDNENYRDTRGVAFSLMGRREEALAEFEFYVGARQDDPRESENVEKRRRWMNALRKGQDPFIEGTD